MKYNPTYTLGNYAFLTSSSNSITASSSRVNVSSLDVEFYIYINTLPASDLYILAGFTDPNGNTPSGTDYDGFTLSIDNTGKLTVYTLQSYTQGVNNKYVFSIKSALFSAGNLYKIRVTQTIPNASVLYVNDLPVAWTTTSANTLVAGTINTPLPYINKYVCYNVSAGTYNASAVSNTNFKFYNIKVSFNGSSGYNYPLSEGYNTVAYDVSGNGNHGTISGTGYWTTATNTYNEVYGCTKVKYLTNVVLVPYLLSGTELYTSVDPVLNVAEKYQNFPLTWWDYQTVVTSPYKYIPNDVAYWTVTSGTFANGGTGANAYIQCNTAGSMNIVSTQAYGEWYFDFYKGNTANDSYIYFINNDAIIDDGYNVNITGAERFTIKRVTGGVGSAILSTTSSYITNNTTYNVKIERSLTGIFTAYIRGGAFGDAWTLVSTSGGSGTNPVTDNTHTTSNYFIMDLDAGDRISNVRFKPNTGFSTVVTSPYRYIPNDIAYWTMGTGTYVNGGTFPNDYIQCSVAGTMYISSTQAYGEWYFDVYKQDVSISAVHIITDNLSPRYSFNGYALVIGASENVSLYRVNGSSVDVTRSGLGYISTTPTMYSYKITRTATGIYTTYIKGGSFGGAWTLVSVVGGGGSNPATDNTYTTSNYFVVDLDANDRIANVRFKPL
ncbi:MAG: hypothetical protein WCT85_01515 [Parachlamydiales bacterium]